MKTENFTAWAFRRNTAILLSLTAAYSIATAWIYDPWSSCILFAAVFAITAAIAIRALWADFELRASWLLIPIAGMPEYRFETSP